MKPTEDTWYASATALAELPPSTTEQMRRAHHPRGGGTCGGPHGALSQPWPCSTWLLAETADRIRGRG